MRSWNASASSTLGCRPSTRSSFRRERSPRRASQMKLLFLPFSIVAGLVAGFLSKKLFDGVWRLVDDEEEPEAEHKEIAIGKLAPPLIIEGAICRAVRGLVDHGARRSFYNMTGSWPGDEAPEPS